MQTAVEIVSFARKHGATARLAFFLTVLAAFAATARAQTLMPTPAPGAGTSPDEETIVPTFETQKLARTYILDIPAPRGQITDRNGAPLARDTSTQLPPTYPLVLDASVRSDGASIHNAVISGTLSP